MTARLLALVLIIGALLAPQPAHAYVDPGAGSLVIQGIIAAVVGVGLTPPVVLAADPQAVHRQIDGRLDQGRRVRCRPVTAAWPPRFVIPVVSCSGTRDACSAR
jgi:hypothetical protein